MQQNLESQHVHYDVEIAQPAAALPQADPKHIDCIVPEPSKEDMESRIPGMVRLPTTELYLNEESESQTKCFVGFCLAVLCSWFPVVFWLTAARVLETCESVTFKVWLKVYGIVPLVGYMLILCCVHGSVKIHSTALLKCATRLRALLPVFNLLLLAWGWFALMAGNDESCTDANRWQKGGAPSLHPRQLAAVVLLSCSCGSLLILCGVSGKYQKKQCVPCASMWRALDPNLKVLKY